MLFDVHTDDWLIKRRDVDLILDDIRPFRQHEFMLLVPVCAATLLLQEVFVIFVFLMVWWFF